MSPEWDLNPEINPDLSLKRSYVENIPGKTFHLEKLLIVTSELLFQTAPYKKKKNMDKEVIPKNDEYTF